MEYTNHEAHAVGLAQKGILWLIPAWVLACLVPGIPQTLLCIVLSMAGIVFIYKLAVAQKSPVPWLWAALQCVPLISFICLVIINQMATGILKRKNVRVGLMGANSSDLDGLLIRR